MFPALAKALGQFDDPLVQRVIWKSLVGAILVFLVLGVAFWYLAGWMAAGLAHWVDWTAHAGIVLLTLALVWFLFPVAMTAVASLFLDEVAEAVEARYYPGRPAARSQRLAAVLLGTLRFTAIAIFLNLLLVVLLIFPPLYAVVFYAVNGYLLGREYFELVAYRRLEERTADTMRRAYRGRLTLAGMVIALMLTIPVVNLVAPIAATAFVLHLFEAMRRERPPDSIGR